MRTESASSHSASSARRPRAAAASLKVPYVTPPYVRRCANDVAPLTWFSSTRMWKRSVSRTEAVYTRPTMNLAVVRRVQVFFCA